MPQRTYFFCKRGTPFLLLLGLSSGLLISQAHATLVPPITFSEAVAEADQIVLGSVIRTSTSWGPEHKFIWTRYTVAVERVWKGAADKKVIISEPGGTLDGQTMEVDGAVAYQSGERVILFLQRFPSGDRRTVGWKQGKVALDANRVAAETSFPEMRALSVDAIGDRIRGAMTKISASTKTSGGAHR